MKKLFILAILVSISSTAFAENDNITTVDGTNTNEASAVTGASNATNAGGFNNVIITDEYYEDGSTRDLGGPQIVDQTIQYSGEYSIKNVPNVSAPALTTTMTETCMGSTSAGAAVVGFGFSFGTTWRDNACVRRLDARQLSSLGYNLGAKELMCDSEAVRQALKRAGKPCFTDLPKQVKQQVNPTAAKDDAAIAGAASGW